MSDKPLIVVCGQPRSGTSMMMRIMEMGGVEVEYDANRNRPELLEIFNNPYGMYEISNPTYTKCFKCWHPHMAQKIPASSKIIYIERNIDDVKASWDAIRRRRKLKHHKMNNISAEEEAQIIQRRNSGIEMMRQKWHDFLKDKNVLIIKFEDIISNSDIILQQIAQFVEVPFDITKAAKAIDKKI